VSEWTVTIDVATLTPPSEELLIELDEAVEQQGGSVSARGEDGPGFTLRLNMDADWPVPAVESAAQLVEKLTDSIPGATWAGITCELAELFEKHAFDPDTPELLSAQDVADVLGVSRQRVWQLAKRTDFPAPYARLGSGPIWTRPAVDRFGRAWDRKPGRPRVSKEYVRRVRDRRQQQHEALHTRVAKGSHRRVDHG